MSTDKALTWLQAALLPAFSIAAAFVVMGVGMALTGTNPVRAYVAIFQGSVGSVYSLTVTGVRLTPLLLAGLGVGLSFRARVFNIGAEGQLYAGAVAATAVALVPLGLPPTLHVVLTLAAGFLGGVMWILVPAYLRAYRGVNEIVSTLMFNYIGIYLADYMVNTSYGPLGEQGAAYSQSPAVPAALHLPLLRSGSSLHLGFVIGLVLAVALYLVIRYTPFGFRLRLIGASEDTAEYAGVDVKLQTMWVMLVSGGLAGLAGAVEILGLKHRLFADFSPGYGYDAIAVALLAQSNPLGIIFSSGFFGALRAGVNRLQQVTGIGSPVAFILQALIILFFIGAMTVKGRDINLPFIGQKAADEGAGS